MKKNILFKITFAMLLAFTVNSFVYFSFGNIYSSSILSYQEFSEQFNSGIYQYRILSGYFLIWIYEFLSSLNIDFQIFKLKFFNPSSEPEMYLSFYILNTFFLVLSSVLMVLLTETKNFTATNSEKLLITVLGIFSITLTQFVILPYDCSSYFFLLLLFWIFTEYLNKNSTVNFIVLAAIIFISTLNRESSALSLSLVTTLLYSKYGLKKETFIPVLVLGVVFIAAYFGMRLMNQSFATNDGNLLIENFTQPKNYLGMLFWLVFFGLTFLLSKGKEQRKNILVFHLFSIPYIAMCFYSGILYEIRLYIPLFLTSLFLTKYQTDFKTAKN